MALAEEEAEELEAPAGVHWGSSTKRGGKKDGAPLPAIVKGGRPAKGRPLTVEYLPRTSIRHHPIEVDGEMVLGRFGCNVNGQWVVRPFLFPS